MFKRLRVFDEVWGRDTSIQARAFRAFVAFFEKKTGSKVFYDESVPVYKSLEMRDLLYLGKKLQQAGVITMLHQRESLPDEPRVYQWAATVSGGAEKPVFTVAEGSSGVSETRALAAAIAESVERYIWRYCRDHFIDTRHLSFKGFDHGEGFSAESGGGEGESLCVQGYSWVKEGKQHIPARLVSGVTFAPEDNASTSLHQSVTNGLATWPTRDGAVCKGLLELIERDAFMVMWLNQLSLNRYDAVEVCSLGRDIAELVAACKKYRFETHFIKLITDAPTHALCVVLVDETGNKPQISIGLKAHPSLATAAEGALLEALRIRRGVYAGIKNGNVAPSQVENIGHMDRLIYWAEDKNVSRLAFLTQGSVCQIVREDWDDEDYDAHLQRLIGWCKEKGYECSSVSLTKSKANVTPWHIEMVVVPQLQWMHLHEKFVKVNEVRRTEVPKQFGYSPRGEAFLSEPHPFA